MQNVIEMALNSPFLQQFNKNRSAAGESAPQDILCDML